MTRFFATDIADHQEKNPVHEGLIVARHPDNTDVNRADRQDIRTRPKSNR